VNPIIVAMTVAALVAACSVMPGLVPGIHVLAV
jgi:hypothetical protein